MDGARPLSMTSTGSTFPQSETSSPQGALAAILSTNRPGVHSLNGGHWFSSGKTTLTASATHPEVFG